MVDFAALRKATKDKKAHLQDKLSKLKGGGKNDFKDPRFWYPERNDDGNASATIRFLPAPDGEKDDFVKIVSYDFTGPGGSYKNKSRKTLGTKVPDPVSEYNSLRWKQGEAGQEDAKTRKTSKTHITNIYVVKDANKPENEGKVFLYRAPATIMDMINVVMFPEEGSDDVAINAFNLISYPKNADSDEIAAWIAENDAPGANLRLKVRTKPGPEKYPEYTASQFESPSTLGNFSEDKLVSIWKQCYPLYSEFLAPESFKSYEDLKEEMNKVLFDDAGVAHTPSSAKTSATSSKVVDDDEIDEEFEKLIANL